MYGRLHVARRDPFGCGHARARRSRSAGARRRPYDSGFTLILEDAPDPDVGEAGHPLIATVCLDCLDPITRRSTWGSIAKEYGVADLDENGEVGGGRLSRLADS